MPEGVVRWFDQRRGDAEVVRDGRAFPVPPGAIEASARHPGARVHFDLRSVDGTEQAVDVRLRQSARGSRHRRRFGTLTGAGRSDTKGVAPFATVHPELHLAERHPLQVARSWATSVAAGDADGALSLYSPAAVVHAGDLALADRAAVRSWIEACPAFGCRCHARVRGEGEAVLVGWAAEDLDGRELAVRSRIAHGELSEQWVVEGVEARPGAAPTEGVPPLVVHTEGAVGQAAEAEARRTVLRALGILDEPVLFARLTLIEEPDPARLRPALAEVHADVNGDLIRAHAAARTMPEAVNLLDHRLRDQLEHRARRREHLHHADAVAEPGEWRHGDLGRERPPYFDRPVEERQLVRHKTFAVEPLTSDEAVFDMEQLDYDFYLFVDLATDSDSIVERLDDGTYRMTRLEPSSLSPAPTAEPVAVADAPVPVLGLQEAIEHLGATGGHHLFFADATSGRGCVLYHRYDGHYGLITPE